MSQEEQVADVSQFRGPAGSRRCESVKAAMHAIASWTGERADALRRASRLTNEQFAERLGISVRTVAYWRKRPDMVPQQQTQEILDAALECASERVKELFTLIVAEKSNAASQGPDPGQRAPQRDFANLDAKFPAEPGHAVSLLDGLTGADIADRQDVTQASWIPGTPASVITDYLLSSSAWQREEEPPGVSANIAATRIRAISKHLIDIDFQFGGGYSRRMLLFYFQSDVLPLLREQHQEPARHEIFSAAAEVVQLLGWSAYDAGRHGAAQRYFLQGLRLAGEADDAMLGGRLLSNLSHQANYLGRYGEAVQFARAAQASVRDRATDTVNALLLATEARALAGGGDARLCAKVLNLAEQAFARRKPSEDPRWIGYFDELELAGEAAHCFRDLGRPREAVKYAAQAIDPVGTPARTRAFITMVAAAGSFRSGNLDEALAHATEAVTSTRSLQSSRYLRSLKDFHKSLQEKYSVSPGVRQFEDLLQRSYPNLQVRA